MKKWLIAILVILIVVISSVYLFIPNYISISQSMTVHANPDGLQRRLFNEKEWPKWLPPGMSNDSAMHFIYNDYGYTIKDKRFSSLLISVNKKNFIAISSLDFIASKTDSTSLYWQAKMPTSYNPIKRFQVYLHSKQIRTDMKVILEKIQSYYADPVNVYGYDIQKSRVVDTAFISTFAASKNYPSVQLVYELIGKLKNYIAAQSAKETGFPMLNISTEDSINFIARVAIPVNKILPPSGDITYKWMPGGGNMLITEVKGGPATVYDAFIRVEDYVKDHRRLSPAIPFFSLVTDRRQETDTSKWITRIYYPVM